MRQDGLPSPRHPHTGLSVSLLRSPPLSLQMGKVSVSRRTCRFHQVKQDEKQAMMHHDPIFSVCEWSHGSSWPHTHNFVHSCSSMQRLSRWMRMFPVVYSTPDMLKRLWQVSTRFVEESKYSIHLPPLADLLVPRRIQHKRRGQGEYEHDPFRKHGCQLCAVCPRLRHNLHSANLNLSPKTGPNRGFAQVKIILAQPTSDVGITQAHLWHPAQTTSFHHPPRLSPIPSFRRYAYKKTRRSPLILFSSALSP
ncbi:hypothetical protein B0T10DRAFT_305548 [Thelonectria olida]|uniref:Uncharacterized protein n=1 Tax=Thelonectria olida TaxID=1576542 RepID=A0A9P8W5B6_9HYPO|nr:hypothetical protein B0T10DRAFT_305548 [Thelonectria olida]